MGKLERGRCGLCCTLLVRLNPEDIIRIKKLGSKEEDFVEYTSRKEPILKRVNGYCSFLWLEKGIASCTIYDSRPKICREYTCISPKETKCSLQRHYSLVELGRSGGAKNVEDN